MFDVVRFFYCASLRNDIAVAAAAAVNDDDGNAHFQYQLLSHRRTHEHVRTNILAHAKAQISSMNVASQNIWSHKKESKKELTKDNH